MLTDLTNMKAIDFNQCARSGSMLPDMSNPIGKEIDAMSDSSQTLPKSMDERRKEMAQNIIKKMRDDQQVGEASEADIEAQKTANRQAFGHSGEGE